MEKVEKFFPKEKFENKEELPPNVKIVETEKGKFRIAYGRHDAEMKPEALGKADAWAPELMGLDYTSSKVSEIEREFNILFRNQQEYREIFKKVENEKGPIFLGDIPELKRGGTWGQF